MSTEALARALGIELTEIPQWNCCGASAAHNTNHLLAQALPARNLALAEAENLDVAVPCAACYSRMKAVREAVRKSDLVRAKVSSVIEMDYHARNDVFSIVEIFAGTSTLQQIEAKVLKPLSGLKVACYYGCLLVRPPELAMDDQEDPQSLDRIIGSLGGTPLTWSGKVSCCGAGHSTTLLPVGFKMIGDILEAAEECGADCIACACPLCLLNLDMRQGDLSKRRKKSFKIPVFYFTELVGFALGISPKVLGFKKHFVDPLPLFKAKNYL
jgi:heterodisulfide reductase subunit B